MRWQIKQIPENIHTEQLAEDLKTSTPAPPALINILYQRGLRNLEGVKQFFTPDTEGLHDPFLIYGMDRAVARLVSAYLNQEKVLLLGDYDVDGTTSVALSVHCLRSYGFNISYYIPDRYKEGYGISHLGVDYGAQIGATLMISMDCGIKAIEQVAYANQKGMEVIICDHHTPGSQLPTALAILDPKQASCTYPFKELTGCGITFKLLQALHQELFPRLKQQAPASPLSQYVDLVAMSIASDIVPIVGENRILAHLGLKKLRDNPLPGIKALMDQDTNGRSWNISDLVFFLGPRINAAGRLNHARQAVEVLLGESDSLVDMALELQVANSKRQAIDQKITDEALDMIQSDPASTERSTTVLHHPSWHKGVVGIVASRLIEHHYRPTILLAHSQDKWVGSARSVKGFDLYQSLEACREYLLQFGGHKYAAGLTLTEDQLRPFKAKFEEVVAQSISEEQKVPILYIDYELPFTEITGKLIRLLNRMAPFGPGNPTPVFLAKGVFVRHKRILKDLHLKLVLEQEGILFEAIGFNMAHKEAILLDGAIDIAFQPYFNEWNGRKKVNLRLKDFKSHGEIHS
ncbi:MAG: single-stranded-DNA-specific exonuclease RecJ [Bacteroidota bacterium]